MKIYLQFIRCYACKKNLIVFYILVVGFIGLNAIVSLLRPTFQAHIIDDLSNPINKDISFFMILLALFLGMILISYIVSYLQIFIISVIAENIAANVRQSIHDKIGTVKVDFFSKVELSDILVKANKDVDAIKTCGITSIITLVSNIAILVVIPPYMFSINKKIAILDIVFLLCVPFISHLFETAIRRVSEQVLQDYNEITSTLENSYNNWFITRSFQCYQYTHDKYEDKNQKYWINTNKQNLLYILNTLSILVLQFLGMVFIWIIGAKEVFKGNMTVGTIMALMNYQAIILNPIIGIANFANEYQTAIVSLRDINSLLHYPDSKSNGKHIENINEIILKEVSFRYSEFGDAVLKNMNIVFKKGVLYAVCGKSGQGKSTLLNLIAGISDPTSGEIYINGIGRIKYNLLTYWNKIGYVMQRSQFFKDTIRKNMFNAENVAKLDEVARYIDIYDEIYSLPELWETEIRTDPFNFSEGQMRRLDILRNILKETEILLFDEVTANIDVNRRKKFYQLLHALAKDKIIIFSTHNAEELKEADKVIDLSALEN